MKGKKRIFAKAVSIALAAGMILTSLPPASVLAAENDVGGGKNAIESGITAHAAYAVSGKIHKYQGDNATATVKISGTEISAQEAADGTYTLSNVPDGAQTLEVSCEGYDTFYEKIDVTSNITKDVALFPAYERAEADGVDYEWDFEQSADSEAWKPFNPAADATGAVTAAESSEGDAKGVALTFPSDGERHSAYLDGIPDIKDGCVEMDVTLKTVQNSYGAKYLGILLRGQSAQTYVVVGSKEWGNRYSWEYWEDGTQNAVNISSSDTRPQGAQLTGGRHTLKVEIKGKRVRYFVDDTVIQNVGEAVDFPQVAGKIGLECAAGSEIIVHNVKVTSYDGPDDGQNAVAGKVVNGSSSAENAVVTLANKNDTSANVQRRTVNANGFYVFGKVPAGTYTQTVSWEEGGAIKSASRDITVAAKTGDGAAYECPGEIDISVAGPSITQQPMAAEWTGASSVSLGVTASGTDLSYQWYECASESGEGAKAIGGASQASYTPVFTQSDYRKYFYCVVSSVAGGISREVRSDIVPVYVKKTVRVQALSCDPGDSGEVKLVAADGTETQAVMSGGAYTAIVPAGDYTLTASFAGYKNYSKSITVGSATEFNIALVPEYVDYAENFAGNEKAKDAWGHLYGPEVQIANDESGRGVSLVYSHDSRTDMSAYPIDAPEFKNGCVEMDIMSTTDEKRRIAVLFRQTGNSGDKWVYIGSGDNDGTWFGEICTGGAYTGQDNAGLMFEKNKPLHLKAEIIDNTVTLWGKALDGGEYVRLQTMKNDNMPQHAGKVAVEAMWSNTLVVSNIKVTSYDDVELAENETVAYGKIVGANASQNVTVTLANKEGAPAFRKEKKVFPGYYRFEKVPAGNYIMSVSWKDAGGLRTRTQDVTLTAGSDSCCVLPLVDLDSTNMPKFTLHPADFTYQYAADTQPSKLSVTTEGGATGLAYQWYACEDESGENAKKIDGATGSEYQPSVTLDNLKDKYCYYCVATCVADGVTRQAQSDIAVMTVEAEASLSGQVKLYDGDAADNVTLKLLDAAGEETQYSLSVAADGSYSLAEGSKVPVGDYKIQASRDGYRTSVEEIRVNKLDYTHDVRLLPDRVDYEEDFAGNENAKDVWRHLYGPEVQIANDESGRGVSLVYSHDGRTDMSAYPINAPEFKNGCIEMDIMSTTDEKRRIAVLFRQTGNSGDKWVYIGSGDDDGTWFGEICTGGAYTNQDNAGLMFEKNKPLHLKAEIIDNTVTLWGKALDGGEYVQLQTMTNANMPQHAGKVAVEAMWSNTLIVSNIKVTSYDDEPAGDGNVVIGKITRGSGAEKANATIKLKSKNGGSVDRAVVTSSGNHFVFRGVPNGDYELKISWKDGETKKTETRTIMVNESDKGYAQVPEINLDNCSAPGIKTQPEDQVCQSGAEDGPSLAAEAETGKAVTYQWYGKKANDAGFTLINGATQASYSPVVDSLDIRQYYCVLTYVDAATGRIGTAQTRTAAVTPKRFLTAPKPSVTAPAGTTVICAPNSADKQLHVTASFGPDDASDNNTLSYQWYQADGAEISENDTPIENVTGATYGIPAISAAGNYYYYCTVTNTNTEETVQTAPVTANSPVFTVIVQREQAEVPAISGLETSCEVETYGSHVFSVTAGVQEEGGALSYQWYEKASADAQQGTEIEGATGDKYTFVKTEAGTYYLYCVVTHTHPHAVNSASATSETATVTVVAPTGVAAPQITKQPQSMEYETGAQIAPLAVEADVAEGKYKNLSYQWYQNTTDSTENGTAISGATESSYTPDDIGNEAKTAYYYCIVTNTNEALADGSKTASVSSEVATVTVIVPSEAAQPQIETNLPAEKTYRKDAADAEALSLAAKLEAGKAGTLSYQWYQNTADSTENGTAINGATESSYTPDVTKAGEAYYYCVVTNTNNNVSGNSKTASVNSDVVKVTVKTERAQKPVISADLSEEAVVYEQGGEAEPLSIETAALTDGGTLSYQWYKKESSISQGQAITGANEASYMPSTAEIGTTYYYCVVTNTNPYAESGSPATVTSKTARVDVNEQTVNPPEEAEAPAITVQPQGAVYTKGETAAAISVTASVTDEGTLSYQWYSSAENSNENGTAINGATGTSYTPSTAEAGTTYYYCVVTNTKDGKTKTVTTNAAKIEVTDSAVNPPEEAEAPAITVQPQGAAYTKGATATALRVEASVTDEGTLSYQWYSSAENSNENGTAINGATGTSYTPSTAEAGTTYYYCVVTNTKDGKTKTVTTNAAKIEVTDSAVNPPEEAEAPAITVQPQGAVYTKGETAAAISVTASVTDEGTLSYQWYSSAENSNENGTAINGATETSYTPSTAEAGTTYYYCVVTNTKDGKTKTVTTNAAKIEVMDSTVNPPEEAEAPAITVQPQGAAYTQGDKATAISVEASVTDGGTLSYQWYSNTIDSNENGTAIDGETEESFIPSTAKTGTTYYYCVVTNKKGEAENASVTDAAKIEVKAPVSPAKAQAPTITKYPAGASYIKGAKAAALAVTAKASDGGVLSYQWYSNTANSYAGRKIMGATRASYTPSTAAVGITYYYCVVTNTKNKTTKTATTKTARIEVKEEPLTVGKPVEQEGLSFTVTNLKTLEVAFAGAKNKSASSVTVPDTITIDKKAYKVTEIKAKAFKGFKKIKKVTIGANIKKIGKQAFYNCKNLKTITIKGTKVKTIQKQAFKGVSKKVTVKMPKKLKKKAKNTLKKNLIKAGVNKKAKFK